MPKPGSPLFPLISLYKLNLDKITKWYYFDTKQESPSVQLRASKEAEGVGVKREKAMIERKKNGTDAEHCVDVYAEFRAVPRAAAFAERCAVIRAVLRADSSAEIMVDRGRNRKQ